MEKTGRVEIGKTPSTVSGNPATKIEDDEPVCGGERPVDPGMKKTAAALQEAAEESTND